MLKKIKLDNYTTFINPTEIDFSATNYKFLETENVGSNKIKVFIPISQLISLSIHL